MKPGGPPARLYREAIAAQQNGRLDEAARRLHSLLRADPGHPGALHALGVMRAQQGRHDDAVALLRRALGRDPGAAEIHNNLGLALHALNRRGEAIACYEKALALSPRYALACNNLGNVLAAEGRLAEAIAQFRKALALAPGYVEARGNLATALLAAKQPAEAVGEFERALEARPGFVQARINYGDALALLERHSDSAAQYEMALALQPGSAPLHRKLADALRALGLCNTAIDHYRRALDLDPRLAGALGGLGIALTEIGRIDEARRCFEQAIAAEPRRPAHYLNLTRVRKARPGDPYLEEMEKLARDIASLAVKEQAELHFALGTALADAGESERSFRHFIDGNALHRGQITYDLAADLDRLDQIRTVFTYGLMRSRPGLGDPSPLPIFIVGMPRSGSTLVEQILASHPSVFAAGERNALRDAVRVLDARSAPARFPQNLRELGGEQLRAVACDYLARMRAIAAASPDSSKPAAPQRITDKLPANFRYAGLINLAMPNARIIHTCRDPVDTCLSCFTILFERQPFTYDLGELGRYYRGYAGLMDHWRGVLPAGVMLDVQYEELVRNFEPQARRILAHCGLDWDPACLRFYDTERHVQTASMMQVRQPVYQSAIGRRRPSGDALRPLLDALALDLPRR